MNSLGFCLKKKKKAPKQSILQLYKVFQGKIHEELLDAVVRADIKANQIRKGGNCCTCGRKR